MEAERQTLLLTAFEERRSEEELKKLEPQQLRNKVSNPFRVDIRTGKIFSQCEGDQMNTNKENLFQADSLFRKKSKL